MLIVLLFLLLLTVHSVKNKMCQNTIIHFVFVLSKENNYINDLIMIQIKYKIKLTELHIIQKKKCINLFEIE